MTRLRESQSFVRYAQVLESEPAIPVTSVVHTISLQRISATNQTFVMWDTDFSNDATSEVGLSMHASIVASVLLL